MAASSVQGSSRSSTLSPPVISGVSPNRPHSMQRTAPYDTAAVTNVLPLLGWTRTNAVFSTETTLEAGNKVYGEHHIQLQLHRSLEVDCQYSYGSGDRNQGPDLYSFQKCYGFTHNHPWSGSCFLFHPECLVALPRHHTWGAATNHTQALTLPPAFGSEIFCPATDFTPSPQAAKHRPGAANHEVFGRN